MSIRIKDKNTKTIKNNKINKTIKPNKTIKNNKINKTNTSFFELFEKELNEINDDIQKITLEYNNIGCNIHKSFEDYLTLLEEEYDIDENNNKRIYWTINDYHKNKDLYLKTKFKLYKFKTMV